ncbi:hypothetical protein ANO11243_029960 [Dothideomycetidae sp. 11243]|nr:hypothetical protein ANO11243_029960 [fungal sp. No.11243]
MPRSAFELLPFELHLNLAHHVEDLESLYNLLRASPRFWRVFDNCSHAAQIANQVLAREPIDIQIKIIIWTIGHVRHDCLPATSLIELQRRVTNDSVTHQSCRIGSFTWSRDHADEEWFMCEADIFVPDCLPAACTPETVRRILSIHRHITYMTLNCLDRLLDKFRKLDFAEHVVDIGAPTWIEEQALARSFWRIAFVYQVKQALSNNTLKWSEEDRDKLMTTANLDVYDFSRITTNLSDGCWFHSCPMDVQIAEHSNLLTATEYLEDPSPMPSQWARSLPAPSPSLNDYNEIQWRWSVGVEWLARVFPETFFLPFNSSSFEIFRRAGFMLWSEDRLHNFGFTSLHKIDDHASDEDRRIWLSVLEDERAAQSFAQADSLCNCHFYSLKYPPISERSEG